MAAAAVQHLPPQPEFQTRHLAADNTPQKRDVKTVLNFYKPSEDGSPPAPSYIDRPETYDRPSESHDVIIHDVRGDEDKYTLDGNGFQFHRRAATEKEFLDDDQVKASYYPETEQLLKDVTGASRVFIFDHTIRRQQPETPSTGPAPKVLRGPVYRVHVDQSYSASLSRVAHHLPDEAAELLKGRVQIINVWRPIRTVERDPLAVAEAHSVRDEDLIPTGLIYPSRKGETYQVAYNPSQKWFYKSRLGPEEVLLIKCFDSKVDGRARRVPHSAFVDTGAAGDAKARESIEVRALVFHEGDTD